MTRNTPKRASQMDTARLSELLDTFGADLARFPEHERQAAAQLLARDAQAASLHAEATRLDELLSSVPGVEISATLRAAVAEIPIRHPRSVTSAWLSWWPWPSLWQAVALGTLAALLGVMGGVVTAQADAVSSDDGWDEVASIAFATGIEDEP